MRSCEQIRIRNVVSREERLVTVHLSPGERRRREKESRIMTGTAGKRDDERGKRLRVEIR